MRSVNEWAERAGVNNASALLYLKLGAAKRATAKDEDKFMSDAMSAILQYVREQRKLDFSVYRSDTIKRRLDQRIAAAGAKDRASYFQFLQNTPSEIDKLIATLTITASHFFRDPLVFDVLETRVLPELYETFSHETLRIWCAGCGRGEEAYSMSILVSNLSHLASQESHSATILATDVDRKVLDEAAEGLFDADSLREVRKGAFDRFFKEESGRYRIAENIRSLVHFVYHDVTTCCPPKEGVFSDYHIILCRNVLIYLNRDIQEEIIQNFHRILRDRGCLVLGESEMILTGDFCEVFPGTKIFRKGGRAA